MKKGNYKHGMVGTRTYKSWERMKERCSNPNHQHYKQYGERGIKVCSEWLGENGFENFYKDIGNRPENKTLDRIDNNGNYCKDNCKWSTHKEQCNNTRTNRLITYKGKTKTMRQWEEGLNVKRGTLWARLNKGWSIKKSLKYRQLKKI